MSEKLVKDVWEPSYGGPDFSITNEDEKLNIVFSQILRNSDYEGKIQSVFLDETEYGNILIVARGWYGEIYSMSAYKITGYEYVEISNIMLKTLDFETVEVAKVGS